MKITITHQRAVVGNDITVGADDDEKLVGRVETKLDGFVIGDDRLNPPNISYDRTFVQQGSYSPHTDHCVEVVAEDGTGKAFYKTHRWTDV